MNIRPINDINTNNIYKVNKVELKSKHVKQSDRIEISDLGKYLNQVNNNREDVNMDKINELRNRIKNGTYKVDSNELAKKIIEKTNGEF